LQPTTQLDGESTNQAARLCEYLPSRCLVSHAPISIQVLRLNETGGLFHYKLVGWSKWSLWSVVIKQTALEPSFILKTDVNDPPARGTVGGAGHVHGVAVGPHRYCSPHHRMSFTSQSRVDASDSTRHERNCAVSKTSHVHALVARGRQYLPGRAWQTLLATNRMCSEQYCVSMTWRAMSSRPEGAVRHVCEPPGVQRAQQAAG